jgi:hypothetical protein
LHSIEGILAQFNNPSGKKYSIRLNENTQLKAGLKDHNPIAIVENLISKSRVVFDFTEIQKLLSFRTYLLYSTNKLVLNQGNVCALYNLYVKSCFDLGKVELSDFDLSISEFPKGKNLLDYQQLFYSIFGTCGIDKICRDKEFYNILPDITSMMQ